MRQKQLMELGEGRRDYENAVDEYHHARASYERVLRRFGRPRELTITAPAAGEVLGVPAAVGDPVIAGDDPEQRDVADLAVVGELDRVIATASSRCGSVPWNLGAQVAFVPAKRRTVRVEGSIVGTTPRGCAIAAIDNTARTLDDGDSGELVAPP
jgi:hypothetical protein